MDDTVNKRSPILPLLVAALLGGGVAAGVTTVLDDDGGGGTTTTVVQQAPLSAGDRSEVGEGLTARDIYKKYAPGVVFIRAEVVQRTQSPFDLFPTEQRGESTGTGFVINRDGSILTNAHVVDNARAVTVQFADKRSVKAKVLGQDLSTDLALLKVDPEGLDLTVLPLGSARDVEVGDPTIAIGNPFGLDRTLTTGVISAKQRQIRAPNDFTISDVLQTDAAINPGNSGGPLIDAKGEVIGVNSQIETADGSRGNVGIGFAVPIDTAKRILDDLKTKGSVQRAYLGVDSITVDGSLAALDLPVDSGALVQTVQDGSPADEAGIRGGDIQAQVQGQAVALGGDIIVKADGKPIRTSDELATVVGAKDAGDEIEVEIVRDGKRKTLKVELDKRPEGTEPGTITPVQPQQQP